MAPAVTLSAAGIEVGLDPDRGGKLTSVRDVVRRREWLVQPAPGTARPAMPGTAFTDGDMCGWDEMFPTVIACAYPLALPGDSAVQLPDHGELWTSRWQVVARGDSSVSMTASGSTLPYRFTRVAAVDRSAVRLEYTVEATEFPLVALWAAHPQFRCVPGTRVVLPDGIAHVLDVSEPARPVSIAWPDVTDGQVTALPVGTGRKLYAEPDAGPAWARLVDPDGTSLTLRWSAADVPYLGVWFDHLRYSREPCVCLEPSTGFYDDLGLAFAQDRVMHLVPGAPITWSVLVEVSEHPSR